jgi:hypothetical protein
VRVATTGIILSLMSKRKAPPSRSKSNNRPKKCQLSPNASLIHSLQTCLEEVNVKVPEKKQQSWRTADDDEDDEDPWSTQHLLDNLSRVEKILFAQSVGGQFYATFCKGTCYAKRSSNEAVDMSFRNAVKQAEKTNVTRLQAKWNQFHSKQMEVCDTIHEEVVGEKQKQWNVFGEKVIEILQDLFLIQSIPILSWHSYRKFIWKKDGEARDSLWPSIIEWMTVDASECDKKFQNKGKQYFIVLKCANSTLIRRLVFENEKSEMQVFDKNLLLTVDSKTKKITKKWSKEHRYLSLSVEQTHRLAEILKLLLVHLYYDIVNLIKEYFCSVDVLSEWLVERTSTLNVLSGWLVERTSTLN